MGKVKKILENELVGGTQTTDVYPVTSTKAVYDENNERLDNILKVSQEKLTELEGKVIGAQEKKIIEVTEKTAGRYIYSRGTILLQDTTGVSYVKYDISNVSIGSNISLKCSLASHNGAFLVDENLNVLDYIDSDNAVSKGYEASNRLQVVTFEMKPGAKFVYADSSDAHVSSLSDLNLTYIAILSEGFESKINAEIQRAKAAEKVNADNLNKEEQRAKGAEEILDKSIQLINNSLTKSYDMEIDYSDEGNEVVTALALNEDGVIIRGKSLFSIAIIKVNKGDRLRFVVKKAGADVSKSICFKAGDKVTDVGTKFNTILHAVPASTESGTTFPSADYDVITEDGYVYIGNHTKDYVTTYKATSEYIDGVKISEAVSAHEATINAISNSVDILSRKHWAMAMWKILCLGDSLTAGAYFNQQWGEVTKKGEIDQNYPRILSRMIGAEVKNGGHSGATTITYYKQYLAEHNLSDYDTFVLWFGTNAGISDTIETDVEPYSNYIDYADTTCGNYCKIIEKIKEQVESPFIVILNIFKFVGGQSASANNIAIGKIAARYNIPVVDMSDLDEVKHPELHCNVNNPHFGKAGNIVIADRIIKAVSKYIEESPIRAEFGITDRSN